MQFSYKIIIICRVFIIANIPLCTPACSQIQPVKKLKIYQLQVSADSSQKMIEVKRIVPTVVYDLKYATENNFTHRKLYKSGKQTFLRLPVVKALQNVQNELAKRNLGLKLFDAYRPYAVTKKMWDLIHDERYVADPSKGSGHNRGLAVDLTIIDLKDGQELNMGTGFDNFTDTAHHGFTSLPKDVLANRQLLKEIMENHGFKLLETEWWHYSWSNAEKFEILDLDIANGKKYFKE